MKYERNMDFWVFDPGDLKAHWLIFWDPTHGYFLDENGFELENEHFLVPNWARELAWMHFGRGKSNYFCYTLDAKTLVEMFFPDEE